MGSWSPRKPIVGLILAAAVAALTVGTPVETAQALPVFRHTDPVRQYAENVEQKLRAKGLETLSEMSVLENECIGRILDMHRAGYSYTVIRQMANPYLFAIGNESWAAVMHMTRDFDRCVDQLGWWRRPDLIPIVSMTMTHFRNTLLSTASNMDQHIRAVLESCRAGG